MRTVAADMTHSGGQNASPASQLGSLMSHRQGVCEDSQYTRCILTHMMRSGGQNASPASQLGSLMSRRQGVCEDSQNTWRILTHMMRSGGQNASTASQLGALMYQEQQGNHTHLDLPTTDADLLHLGNVILSQTLPFNAPAQLTRQQDQNTAFHQGNAPA
jgi:hypothetical protein